MITTKQLIFALLPIVGTILWHLVDTTPSLAFYDLLVRDTDFANQTIWITGASSGIGASLVCQFAKHAAHGNGPSHVILSARREAKMKDVLQTCRRDATKENASATASTMGTTFSVVPYDALDATTTEKTVQQAIESTPARSIDVLILNSGIYQLQPALEMTTEERRKLARVNLEAPIELSQALIQQDHWKERGRGHLVVVSSIMSKGPHSLCSFYAATKAGLRSYFQTLSLEEFDWLKVNMVLPGATASDMWKNSLDDETVQVDQSGMMTPERVAHLIVKAMAGPTFLFWEVWISKANGLFYVFMSHYFPGLFYALNHIAGIARMAEFRKSNSDVIDIPSWIQILYQEAVIRLKG